MANPQKENGYTAISNEFIEALAKIRIPGEANQCLLVIFRKTWGWNKKTDKISLSQYVDGTGIKKPHVCRALSQLEKMNIITVAKKHNDSTEYAIQKDFDKWLPLPKKVTLPKKVMTVTKKGNGKKEVEAKKEAVKEAISAKSTKNLDNTTITKKGTHKNTIIKPSITKVTRGKKIENIIPPQIENVIMYFQEKGFSGETGKSHAEHFHDHFTSNGWVVGKARTPMKNWKAAVRNWIRNIGTWGNGREKAIRRDKVGAHEEINETEEHRIKYKPHRWCESVVLHHKENLNVSSFSDYFDNPTFEKLKALSPEIKKLCTLVDKPTADKFKEKIKLEE